MALMSRLRVLLRRPASASKVGLRRRRSVEEPADIVHEDALRTMLAEDPNNVRAFKALAEIVRGHAAGVRVDDEDPLTADPTDDERQRAADLAVWALAEELAGHPRAWYPLIELARLSLDDDHDNALRRLATASERDPSGAALAEGLAVLREAGMPVDALGLGVGHWRPREHVPEAGRQIVLAALEADRPFDARANLEALRAHPDQETVAGISAELERALAQAEQHRAGT